GECSGEAFFFSSRRRHTRFSRDWSSDVCSSDLGEHTQQKPSVAEGGALAHYNLGLAFRQKALYDEALREFRLAAERGEDRFLVQQAQAEMLLLRGAGDEATQVYRSLIDLEAGSPKLWNELGVAHHQSGQLEEAERAYQRALDLDPL